MKREPLGGECEYWACVPSKAVLRPVIAVADPRRVEGAEEAVNAPLDAAATFARRDGFVSQWQDGHNAHWLKGIGAEVVRGHGRLDGPRRVAVETRSDGRVVLAACGGRLHRQPRRGARPARHRRCPARDQPRRHHRQQGARAAGRRRRGGVGTEMASAYQGLGASVTLLVHGQRLLPRMGPYVGEMVNEGWLYAMGDVNHHALLTHQGKYQARIAGAAIAARAAGQPLDTAPWGAHATTADFHAVPQVFFCDPEAAAVGLSAEQERAGHRVRAVDVDLGQVEEALEYADGYRGRARMVVHLDHGYLLGVAFVGPGVAELLHSATVAVAQQVPVDRLWHAVPCFPSISEVWLRLLEAYRG